MTTALVLAAGALVGLGVVALAAAWSPAPPQLQAALARAGDTDPPGGRGRDVGPVTSRSERLGAAVYRRSPVPLSDRQRRALKLQDKSIAEFYADKVVMAVVGAALPAVLGSALALMTARTWSPLPVAVALVGAVVGFFVPDLLLRRAAVTVRSGAVDALLLYLELVTLERLANASAPQALQNAATLSDVPLFVQIRSALDRARLEQQAPYGELRRLAVQLDLPELGDVADVMQLDETGAALSEALRARVRELRGAHLTQEQIAASAQAEGMTLYMALPALIFGLIFLVAALLRILGG